MEAGMGGRNGRQGWEARMGGWDRREGRVAEQSDKEREARREVR